MISRFLPWTLSLVLATSGLAQGKFIEAEARTISFKATNFQRHLEEMNQVLAEDLSSFQKYLELVWLHGATKANAFVLSRAVTDLYTSEAFDNLSHPRGEEISAHLNAMADTSSLLGELSRQMGEYSRILSSQGPETLENPGKIEDAIRKQVKQGELLAADLRHSLSQLLEILRI